MPGITAIVPEFAVELTKRNVRVPAVVVTDPCKFLFSMGVRMRFVWPVAGISKRMPGSIEFPVPAHQGSSGNVIAAADKPDITALPVK